MNEHFNRLREMIDNDTMVRMHGSYVGSYGDMVEYDEDDIHAFDAIIEMHVVCCDGGEYEDCWVIEQADGANQVDLLKALPQLIKNCDNIPVHLIRHALAIEENLAKNSIVGIANDLVIRIETQHDLTLAKLGGAKIISAIGFSEGYLP